MPQMAPIMWVNILILSLLLVVLMMSINYFMKEVINKKNFFNTSGINMKKWMW